MKKNSLNLWLRWVAANGLGEMIGLGLTFAAGYATVVLFGEGAGILGLATTTLSYVLTGAIEGTVIGLAQYWAMQPYFPTISRKAWWSATVLGAMVAWFFGSLPFSLINLNSTSEATQAPVQEPSQWIVLLAAAGIGLVAGVVLAFFQWLVLRRSVRHAGWWLPANALAWAVGMVVIFAAMDFIFTGLQTWQMVLVGAAALFVTGAMVGAVEGLFLVRIAPVNPQNPRV